MSMQAHAAAIWGRFLLGCTCSVFLTIGCDKSPEPGPPSEAVSTSATANRVLPPAPSPKDSSEPSIAGRVVDSGGRGLGGVSVLALDDRKGFEIERKPIVAITDKQGRFHFDDLSTGAYRLVAQSWHSKSTAAGSDEQLPELLLGIKKSPILQIHGAVDRVGVPSSSAKQVELRPLGTGALHVTLRDSNSGNQRTSLQQYFRTGKAPPQLPDPTEMLKFARTLVGKHSFPNDDSMLVISRAPPVADPPVFGLDSWGGEFSRNVIAVNPSMPDGETFVIGLPGATIYLEALQNDNFPSFYSMAIESLPGGLLPVDMAYYIRGAESIRDYPIPPRLRPVIEELQAMANPEKAVFEILGFDEDRAMSAVETVRKWRADESIRRAQNLAELGRPLGRKLKTPGGLETTAADLLTAAEYVHWRAKE